MSSNDVRISYLMESPEATVLEVIGAPLQLSAI